MSVLDVPAIFGAEVMSAVRSWLHRGEISELAAAGAVRALAALRTEEHPLAPFASRIWELRTNLTVYDAWYVALAEALGAVLVTADRRLAGATGPRCEVVDVRTFAGHR